jgi:hypothetical protein
MYEACPDRIQIQQGLMYHFPVKNRFKFMAKKTLLEADPPIWDSVRWFPTLLSCPLQA